jgi:hypothetical protein
MFKDYNDMVEEEKKNVSSPDCLIIDREAHPARIIKTVKSGSATREATSGRSQSQRMASRSS